MRGGNTGFLSALALVTAATLGSARPAQAYDKHACVAASDAAQALRLDGKLLEAREQFLVCADPSCPKIVQSACAQWISGLDAQIPTVVVHAREADGHDAVDAQILVDGKPRDRGMRGTALSLDPGKHELRVVASDGRTTTEAMVITEGEQLRRIDATLPPRPGVVLASASVTGASPADASPGVPWAAWGVTGGAVVAWGLFAGFAVSGNHDYSLARNDCTSGCSAQYPTGKFVAADIALGVAIAASGTAAILFLTHRSDTRVARAAAVLARGVEF